MALLVASIDFGTTYSGWAFSFRHDFERDPLKISAKQWTGGQLVSQKGPTSVLIKPDGKTLDKFGFEAESKYAELAMDQCYKKYYFFKRFKMLLFGNIGVKRNMLIMDATGKKLPAKRVFSLAIHFLKEDLLAQSENRLSSGELTGNDVHWVLTAPAIWNDAAKQFMREAAEEAGISGDQLTIALEPEAASLYCRHLPVEKSTPSSLAAFQAGTKYLVLDAGGGTVDVTVHEVTRTGELKELHKASGGAWGGTKVDDAFEKFIDEITGVGVMKRFKDNHMEDYVDLFRDFETKKRDIAPGKESKINFRIPLSLMDVVKEVTDKTIKETIQSSKYACKINAVSDKLRVDAEVATSLFDGPVRSVLDHVGSLLRLPNVRGCNMIVMVGGFCESLVLQTRVKERFRNLKTIVPIEAGLAVLKGPVIFGHSPKSISERICKFTYGNDTTHAYSYLCNHRIGKLEKDRNGVMRCYDQFLVHARVGQAVKFGEEQPEQICCPVYDDQRSMDFDIYASSNESPQLVTEAGCSEIGTLSVPIYDTSLGRKHQFGVSFLFGGTEIEVKVVDKSTGKAVAKKTVDFLG